MTNYAIVGNAKEHCSFSVDNPIVFGSNAVKARGIILSY